MANNAPSGNVNHSLAHRGVTFSIRRISEMDAPSVYRWAIHPASGPAEGVAAGEVDGPRAFARAHSAAVAAVDEWLKGKPGDGDGAV